MLNTHKSQLTTQYSQVTTHYSQLTHYSHIKVKLIKKTKGYQRVIDTLLNYKRISSLEPGQIINDERIWKQI